MSNLPTQRSPSPSDRHPPASGNDDPLRFIEPVLSYGDMCSALALTWGPVFPAQRLIEMMGEYSWEGAFLKLARIAALLANSPEGLHDSIVRAWTTDLLASQLEHHHPEVRVVAFYVAVNAPRVLAHEEVIYFLQASAILHGRDGGDAPPEYLIALWILAGNDHCFGWREESSFLTNTQELLATSARAQLFNHRQDTLPPLVRAVSLFEQVPPRTRDWRNGDDWRAFQQKALGAALEEYVDYLVGALYVYATGWGTDQGDGLKSPMFAPAAWVSAVGVPLKLGQGYFDRVAGSREEMKSLLQPFLGHDGLPKGSLAFFIKPFVRFADGQVVAASPWVVREQIRGGIWSAHLEQAKLIHGDRGGAQRWLSAFGDLFEQWCRGVAQMASSSPGFSGVVLLSDTLGDEQEIEDVVVVDQGNALLASAKARTIKQDLIKGVRSAGELIEWYEEFLFGARKSSHRAGAVRLLDQKVRLVRAGSYASNGLPADCRIFPMIVTYDVMGTDTPTFHGWLQQRCRDENLLQGEAVEPLVIVHIELFEQLMGYAAAGGSVFSVLGSRGAEARLDVALHDAAEGLQDLRVPGLAEKYDVIMKRLLRRSRVPDSR